MTKNELACTDLDLIDGGDRLARWIIEQLLKIFDRKV